MGHVTPPIVMPPGAIAVIGPLAFTVVPLPLEPEPPVAHVTDTLLLDEEPDDVLVAVEDDEELEELDEVDETLTLPGWPGAPLTVVGLIVWSAPRRHAITTRSPTANPSVSAAPLAPSLHAIPPTLMCV
jgi:hypothetical protein